MLKSLATLRRYILAAALLLTFSPALSIAQTPAKPPASAATDDASKLDLNTATPAQLKALPGIGDAYSKRIIDGRPYTAKNQLTQKGILPQKTYDAIKDMIVARRATATRK